MEVLKARCPHCECTMLLNEDGFADEKYLSCPECEGIMLNSYWTGEERERSYIG